MSRIQDRIDPAAEIARDGAHQQAEDRAVTATRAMMPCDPRTVNDAAEDVAAEVVGAQPVAGSARGFSRLPRFCTKGSCGAIQGASTATSTKSPTMNSPAMASRFRRMRSQASHICPSFACRREVGFGSASQARRAVMSAPLDRQGRYRMSDAMLSVTKATPTTTVPPSTAGMSDAKSASVMYLRGRARRRSSWSGPSLPGRRN